MKKIFAIFIISLALAACASEDDVFEISERFYVMQFMEVQFNREDFLGRTIRYEGIFGLMEWYGSDSFYFVYRNVIGCCGPEGTLGFELYMNDKRAPEIGAWVEVTGILESFIYVDQEFLRLSVTSLIEKDERGEETVMGF